MHIRTTLGFRCLLASRWNLLARHTRKVGESHPFGFRGCTSNSLGKDPANQSLCGQDKCTIRSGRPRVAVACGHRPLSNPQLGFVGAGGVCRCVEWLSAATRLASVLFQSAAAACRRVLGFDEWRVGERASRASGRVRTRDSRGRDGVREVAGPPEAGAIDGLLR